MGGAKRNPSRLFEDRGARKKILTAEDSEIKTGAKNERWVEGTRYCPSLPCL